MVLSSWRDSEFLFEPPLYFSQDYIMYLDLTIIGYGLCVNLHFGCISDASLSDNVHLDS